MVVVIDPGHNGKNGAHTSEINRLVDAGGFKKACNTTGTSGGSYSEATFNWEVAQRVKPLLEAEGVTVVMTRSSNDGWGPCVDERGQVAARAHAAALVSIHADGSAVGNRGFHVIYPTSIAGFTDSTAAASSKLATRMRDSLEAGGFAASNYVGANGLDKRGDLGTLNRAEVPAIIIECGNMRDPEDLALLKSSAAQGRLAAAIVAGVMANLRS